MTLHAHGDLKYQTSQRLSDAAEWPGLRVEHRLLKTGPQNALTPECTEVVLMLSGRAGVSRTGNGQTQDVLAQPGMSWIVPIGTEESKIELSGSMECLHLYLPPTLIERSALADYEIDPAKAELAYAGGLADPMLHQIGSAFRSLLGRGMQPTDRLFVDGMQTALAAHLLGNYAVDRWQPPPKAPSLDPKRLKRVLDFIEARIGADISLDDLAAEACLSPFHFSRLFRDATGLTPNRYVTDRRVQAAREKLALDHSSLVEIALDTGFGSQANFIRVFRKVTGVTPGQYRELHRR
ncbi:AraC family transcriptional regulator [Sinorhizobium mexicanum]|uniref:Helix-turn-helix domain-containing protein n=1 Tax=Sinorhizobium mexicanum TaxID=375549 RepID=A0A859QE71_9HYPH|nr:AraC family transcriptional regulator [Sinorhizobium mexicanum]MBP1886366.1 AraC family transcriptional regulator [Sinorhizobium mexicanum]QLL64033.1 helix-turn-helix domain-containing protein [Sinorhizobium mexicanum]